jgi:enhancing lycopene biosynthesis protein 2
VNAAFANNPAAPEQSTNPAMPKVAVILAGCGYLDGAEIQESVITLLELDKAGVEVQCFAPDIQQEHVVCHIDGKVSSFRERNVLEEAARIARGDIVPLADFKVADFAAVLLPGGQGIIKNLSNFAYEGPNCAVDGELERVILDTYKSGKPIGASCLAPVVVARVLGAENIPALVTMGRDKKMAQAIRDCGCVHADCNVEDIIIDEKHKVVSTPAYMYDATTIAKVANGIGKLVKAVLSMTK